MAEATFSQRARNCPWCDASAAPEATHCPSCGAALAQRTSIGGLTIPGVTTVDPALQAYAAQPPRIPGNSPSQSMAGSAIVAAAALPGPVALAAIGGVVGVAALEYMGARRGEGAPPIELESVGRPSEIAREVAERLDRLDREARTDRPRRPGDPDPSTADPGATG